MSELLQERESVRAVVDRCGDERVQSGYISNIQQGLKPQTARLDRHDE